MEYAAPGSIPTPEAADPAVLERLSDKELLRFTTAGSVDDGKSTLIGRLLYETASVYADQVAEAAKHTRNASIQAAGEEIDFSLLTDGLRAEREQGITIDVAYRYFATDKRKFIIADTPGHEQYTRNMATGASTARLALILIDARHGVLPQSQRHAFITSLLGIKHAVVCVNKMDLVDYDQAVFDRIQHDFLDFASRLEIPDLRFLPISALKGDNVVRRSEAMPWFQGRPLLELLETIHVSADRNLIDLRFPVQVVLRPDQDFRGFAGRLASGIVRPGDDVMALPSRQTSKIKRIVTYDGDLEQAFPPQSVTLVLEDEIDLSRGDMLVRPNNQPRVLRHLEVMLVWLSQTPLREGATYGLIHTSQQTRARVESLRYKTDVETLSRQLPGTSEEPSLQLNEIGRVVLSVRRPLLCDPYRKNRQTGSLILIDPVTNATVGAGMIIDREPTDALPTSGQAWDETEPPSAAAAESRVDTAERAKRFNQQPATVWLTGLPASGAKEIGYALERLLFERGKQAVVLDGRATRASLSSDLGFDPADTSEHLRRVSAMARILNDSGQIVICSFVSPTRHVRQRARDLIGRDRFLEVYVASALAWCEEQDPHKVYARARAGELVHVPGVDAPYEAPEEPALTLRPDQDELHYLAQRLFDLLTARRLL